jgi:D-sedoheptulose 7-phosphate isomerase
MEEEIIAQLKESARVKRAVADTLAGVIADAAQAIADAFRAGGKLLIIGNGGSAADAQHLAAEFVSHFRLKRRALPALALTTDTSILSAIGNDSGFEFVFSRQVEAFANHPSDILLAISTSGDSRNVLRAVAFAKRKKLQTIGLTGQSGALRGKVDFAIAVPSKDTQHIQEAHLAIEHIMCDCVERELFS